MRLAVAEGDEDRHSLHLDLWQVWPEGWQGLPAGTAGWAKAETEEWDGKEDLWDPQEEEEERVTEGCPGCSLPFMFKAEKLS